MSTFVVVNTYTHSVTYVTENILRSLQDIVRLSGLDPGQIADEWETLQRGIRTWLDSKHLETIVLEVYNPTTDALIGRWDIDIAYDWNGDNGRFWVDTEQIKAAIKEGGSVAGREQIQDCLYEQEWASRRSWLVTHHLAFHFWNDQAEFRNHHRAQRSWCRSKLLQKEAITMNSSAIDSVSIWLTELLLPDSTNEADRLARAQLKT
jgi:hypothetical protein